MSVGTTSQQLLHFCVKLVPLVHINQLNSERNHIKVPRLTGFLSVYRAYKYVWSSKMAKNNQTYTMKASEIEKKWFIVDAEGKTLGRLASQIAYILRGKHKPTFTAHLDMGDNVIVINAAKVKLSSTKNLTKLYHRHTGFFGGIKTQTAAEIRESQPERLVEYAVKGMLPHNRLGNQVYGHLKVYAGTEHPHASQNPLPLPERTVLTAKN